MSEQMLTLLKFGLLGLLYLFFVVALRTVWSEVRRPASGAASPAPSGPPPTLGKPRSAMAAGAVGVAGAATAAGVAGAADVPAAPRRGETPPVTARSAAPAGQHSAAPKPKGEARRPGKLTVVAPPGLAGRSYPLDGEITVGRAAGCGICIDDTFVSTIHARVYAADPYWMVEDLGSTNGTLFNGAKLEAPQVIRPGDQIQLGSTILELQ